jgi:hypothetical protein
VHLLDIDGRHGPPPASRQRRYLAHTPLALVF